MKKNYIVRLSCAEHDQRKSVLNKLNNSSQKVRRAQIHLKSDVEGPGWPDAEIAEASSCRLQTVENLRKRLVTEGFKVAIGGKPRLNAPREKILDGKQEAKVIALRLGKPSQGFANCSLRL